MAKERLGVGIIGAGFVGKFHIRSWVGVRHSDILGILSRSEASATEAAALCRELGVGDAKVFASVTDMVADPTIDALWVCAPNYTRLEIMEEIVEAVVSGKGEAYKLRELVRRAGLLDGFLENQIFTPATVRGKEIVWTRGAALTGEPYLARAAEEHSGPHMPWFWEGELQGGGVINDMMCHSVEVARFLLTPPGASRGYLTPVKVSAYASCLKWQDPHYAKILSDNSDGQLDYINRPAEDFARSLIEYRDANGGRKIVETTTSWCFVGAGLRQTMELLGPEYSMSLTSLDSGLKVFFSRNVTGDVGEDLVEKQNAETGLMPVVAHEASEYGYEPENRHMVERFLAGERPSENFDDGVNVTELLMTAYMSVEQERAIAFPPPDLESYVPAVARGEWNPRNS
jgi:predicted dehydrogenase